MASGTYGDNPRPTIFLPCSMQSRSRQCALRDTAGATAACPRPVTGWSKRNDPSIKQSVDHLSCLLSGARARGDRDSHHLALPPALTSSPRPSSLVPGQASRRSPAWVASVPLLGRKCIAPRSCSPSLREPHYRIYQDWLGLGGTTLLLITHTPFQEDNNGTTFRFYFRFVAASRLA